MSVPPAHDTAMPKQGKRECLVCRIGWADRRDTPQCAAGTPHTWERKPPLGVECLACGLVAYSQRSLQSQRVCTRAWNGEHVFPSVTTEGDSVDGYKYVPQDSAWLAGRQGYGYSPGYSSRR